MTDVDDLVPELKPAPREGAQQLITRQGQDEMFCQSYSRSLSAIKSAVFAYHMPQESANKNAWRILERPHIAARVAYLLERAHEEASVHPRQLVEELRNQAMADHLEVFSNETLVQLGLDNISEETRRAIEAIEFDALYGNELDEDGNRMRVQIGNRVKVKFYSKQKAIELLARMFAMFKDRIEHTGKDGEPLPGNLTPESAEILAAKVGSLLARAERRMLEQQQQEGETDVEDLV